MDLLRAAATARFLNQPPRNPLSDSLPPALRPASLHWRESHPLVHWATSLHWRESHPLAHWATSLHWRESHPLAHWATSLHWRESPRPGGENRPHEPTKSKRSTKA